MSDDAVDQSYALTVHEPGFALRAGPGARSSTRSSPTGSGTGARATTRSRGTRRDSPAIRATPTRAAIPAAAARTLRGIRSSSFPGPRSPRATAGTTSRPTPSARSASPSRQPVARAARPGLFRRRPPGRDREARLPGAARRHRGLLQPDLRRRVEPRVRHTGLLANRSVLRQPRPVAAARTRGDPPRHPDHPRRRVQSHVVGQPAVRPLRPLRADRRVQSLELAVPSLVPLLQRRRTVRVPATTRAGSVSTASPCSRSRGRTCRRTSSTARATSRSCGSIEARVAGAWTSRATRRSRAATGRSSGPRSRGEPERADDQRDLAEGHDAPADPQGRPSRHDDELPPARRGARPARAGQLRYEGLRR